MVLVRYRSRILFSLGEWSPLFQSRFLVSEPTQDIIHISKIKFNLQGFNLLWQSFSALSFIYYSKYPDY